MSPKPEIFKSKPEANRPHFVDLDFPFGQAVMEDLEEGVLYAKVNREVLLFGHKKPAHLHTVKAGDLGTNALILTEIHNSDQYIVEYTVLHIANYLNALLGVETQAPHEHNGIEVIKDKSDNYSYNIKIGSNWQMEYRPETIISEVNKSSSVIGTVLLRPIVESRDLRKAKF